MFKAKKIIAIIPARGASKRIPRKNIRPLAGKPLLAWTIEPALKCEILDRVVVSTEDKEIAEIARRYGAEVVKRPQRLAIDKTKTIDVVFHTLNTLKRRKYIPEVVVLLQPTSPLRTAEDIKAAIGLFLKNKTEFLVSVCRSCHPIHTYFNVGRRYLRPILGWRYFLKSETSGPLEAYVPNGAIYISTPQNLKKYKTFFSPKTLPYIMPPERSIDIDEETDLKLAELLLNPVRKRRG